MRIHGGRSDDDDGMTVQDVWEMRKVFLDLWEEGCVVEVREDAVLGG